MRVKLSQETADFALEIRLRAERGLGEVLTRTPKHKGRLKRGPAVPKGNYGEPSTLAELGITKQSLQPSSETGCGSEQDVRSKNRFR